jgi:hypothetical protein
MAVRQFAPQGGAELEQADVPAVRGARVEAALAPRDGTQPRLRYTAMQSGAPYTRAHEATLTLDAGVTDLAPVRAV